MTSPTEVNRKFSDGWVAANEYKQCNVCGRLTGRVYRKITTRDGDLYICSSRCHTAYLRARRHENYPADNFD